MSERDTSPPDQQDQPGPDEPNVYLAILDPEGPDAQALRRLAVISAFAARAAAAGPLQAETTIH